MADSIKLPNAVKFAADSAAYLLERDGALLLGEEVVLSDGQQPQMSALCLRGFGAPEPDGVWSISASAELEVRLRAVTPDTRYWLVITMMPFGAGDHRASISMNVNGGPSKPVLQRSQGWEVVEAECQVRMLGRKGVLQVEFQVNNPSSPRSLGIGGDDRTLGVKVAALRVVDSGARERIQAAARPGLSDQAAGVSNVQRLPLIHRVAARSPFLRNILLDKNPLVRLIRWMRRVSRSLIALQEQMSVMLRFADMQLQIPAASAVQGQEVIALLQSSADEIRTLRSECTALTRQVAALKNSGVAVAELVTAAHVKLDLAGVAIDQGRIEIARAVQGGALIEANPQPLRNGSRMVLRKTSSWIIGTEFGYFSCDERDDLLALCLIEYGDVERGLRLFLQNVLREGDVFVDVGANIGLHTVVGAKAVGPSGRVFAIEAMPRTLDHLRASVRLSGVEHTVSILPFAAAARAEDGREFHVGAISGHSSLYDLPDAVDVVRVDVRPMDLIVETDQMALVKIDVEGAELEVIAGMEMLLKRFPDAALVLEYAESHLERVGTTREAWEQMRAKHGFLMYLIDDMTGECAKIDDFGLLNGRASSNLLFCRPQSPLVAAAGGGQ
ncbi:FkbM family methyltransferase [Xanthomonas campestris pv. passiflorae]|uniref:FkbM family methyltransferase n=1 Tax=Xanthomonas campestris TaxID=339 RepID=UPI0024290274|nr:FkbM family methyltransferase [Xanthomonas campestris]MBV6813260.1 FkbM family methyltransferase [Xanthomonas campestris pv. passiflorae]